MNIFDITPAGAYVNAIEAATPKNYQLAVCRPSVATTASRQGRLAMAVRSAVSQLGKAAAGLQSLAYSRSRTAYDLR